MLDALTIEVIFKSEKDADQWRLQIENLSDVKLELMPSGKYSGKSKNMHTTFCPYSLRLRISNSIHKYSKNNNIELFSIDHAIKAIYILCKSFGLSTYECKVKYLEIGVNIPLSHSPKYFLERLQAFKPNRGKHKPFLPVLSHRKGGAAPILYTASYDEYSVKCYDKGAQANAKAINLLRFEIKFHRMRKLIRILNLKHKKEITLADLAEKSILLNLKDLIKEYWYYVELKDSYDLNNLQPKEATLYYAGQNPQFWSYLYGRSIFTAKEYKLKYFKIIKQLTKTEMRKIYNLSFERALNNLG